MATSKTLAPTNVTISIPAMTDAPDASVFSNCVDKEADAINALNSQMTYKGDVISIGDNSKSLTANLEDLWTTLPKGQFPILIKVVALYGDWYGYISHYGSGNTHYGSGVFTRYDNNAYVAFMNNGVISTKQITLV